MKNITNLKILLKNIIMILLLLMPLFDIIKINISKNRIKIEIKKKANHLNLSFNRLSCNKKCRIMKIICMHSSSFQLFIKIYTNLCYNHFLL